MSKIKDIAIVSCEGNDFNMWDYHLISEGYFTENYQDAAKIQTPTHKTSYDLWLPDGNGVCRVTKKAPFNKFMGVLTLEYLLHGDYDVSNCYVLGVSKTNFRIDISDII